jgi:hypothetical protein
MTIQLPETKKNKNKRYTVQSYIQYADYNNDRIWLVACMSQIIVHLGSLEIV